MSTARRVICASARAFTHPKKKGGGNPVDIFMAPSTITPNERINLAKSCSWESIVIDNINSDLPKFHFYMPSGEEVSFCGHAAIGACSFLANKHSMISSTSEEGCNSNVLLQQQSTGSISFETAIEGLLYNAKVSKNEVELIMNTKHYEQEYSSSQLQCCSEDLLSEIGLSNKDVSSDSDTLPVFINSSVARYKTLIPIASIETLHAATNPKDPDKFRNLCESIDSTGIYLYSICTNDEETNEKKEKCITLECRQFPKSSGYQEDPATGIAAGALVCSLYKRGINVEHFDILQGTAMNRPSQIKVKIDSYKAEESNPSIKISYTGEVVFDKIYHDLE